MHQAGAFIQDCDGPSMQRNSSHLLCYVVTCNAAQLVAAEPPSDHGTLNAIAASVH